MEEEKLKKQIEKMDLFLDLVNEGKNTITPQAVKEFLQYILSVISNTKTEFNKLTLAQVNEIKEALSYIEKQHTEFTDVISKQNDKARKSIMAFLDEAKYTLDEVKKERNESHEEAEFILSEIRDNRDLEAQRIIEEVKKLIPPPVAELTGENIVGKLGELQGDARPSITIFKDFEDSVNGLLQKHNFGAYPGFFAVQTFQHLQDVPNSYAGQAGKYLIVNSSETGLEFTTASGGGGSGTVTSVGMSGGTTGLTFSGSPITTSGTITMAGTLGVANGGTGTTTQFTTGSIIFAGASGVYSQDNSNLFWDDTNNRLGVGLATPSFTFHVYGNTSGGHTMIERLTTATTGLAGTARFRATSSGDMADSFGSQIALDIKDDAGVSNEIAVIGALRNGADNTGYLAFYTANAGSSSSRMRVDHNALSPISNDQIPLGTASISWADLFLASGGVINWNNGTYTLTQSSTTLTASGNFSVGTSNVITAGTIELGHATANTLSASSGILSIEGVAIPTISSTHTLTNKTISLGSNTISGTIAQFNTACSDADFSTLAGAETLTNKTINLSNNTLSGTIAQFNTACSDADFATLTGTETLTNKTLTTPTINGATLTGDFKIDGTPDNDDTFNGFSINTFNAGATIAQWETVYLNSSSQWVLTDADAENTAGGVIVGIATESGTSGNPLRVALPNTFCRNDAWAWNPGAELYLSTTAGAITETAPSGTDDVVRIVGYAVNADVILWNPSNDWITRV